MMFEPKSFYSSYQYDYYVYKLMTLKTIIENVDKFKADFLDGVVDGFQKDDYLRTLKSDIRQTLYHSIETVFELIFALTPPNEQQLDDRNILANLTNSRWRENNKKIKKIATTDTGLDFLDKQLNIKEQKIGVSRYLFYYGVFPNNGAIPKEYLDLIDPSIDAIKVGLKIIANEYTDRKEYNSYKHGMRIVPAMKHFYILNAETNKAVMDGDLTDSMTYLHFGDNESEIEVTTKLFDTERDIGLAMFCSNLISNMILLRKAGFGLIKENERVPILFFETEEIKNLNKFGVAIQNLKFKVKEE